MELLILATVLGGLYLFSQSKKTPHTPPPTHTSPQSAAQVAAQSAGSTAQYLAGNLVKANPNAPTAGVIQSLGSGANAVAAAAASGNNSQIEAAGIQAGGAAVAAAITGGFNVALQLAKNPPTPASSNLDLSGSSLDDWGDPISYDPYANGADPTTALADPGALEYDNGGGYTEPLAYDSSSLSVDSVDSVDQSVTYGDTANYDFAGDW